MDISEILELKFPGIDLRTQSVIQDDGKGPYIAKWDGSLGPKPIQADLDQWAIELQDQYKLQQIEDARKVAYPPKDDLIIALWERIVENKPNATDKLQSIREQVKVENPKPEELNDK